MISMVTNGFQLLLNYIVSIIVCIVVALALKLPLPIFAMGILAIFFSFNIYWIYDGLALAVIIGILSSLFVKYFFYYIFPNPAENDSIDGGDES